MVENSSKKSQILHFLGLAKRDNLMFFFTDPIVFKDQFEYQKCYGMTPFETLLRYFVVSAFFVSRS